jgi:hypothetical protein
MDPLSGNHFWFRPSCKAEHGSFLVDPERRAWESNDVQRLASDNRFCVRSFKPGKKQTMRVLLERTR